MWFTNDYNKTENNLVSQDPFYPVRTMFSTRIYDDVIFTDRYILHLFRDTTNHTHRSESCFSINAAMFLPSLQAVLHKYGMSKGVMDDKRFFRCVGNVAGYKNSYSNMSNNDISSLVVMMKTVVCGSSIIKYISKDGGSLDEVYEYCLNLLRKSILDGDYEISGTDNTPVVRKMCTYVTARYNYEIMNLLMVGTGLRYRKTPTGVSGINSQMVVPVINAVDGFLSSDGADFRSLDPFVFVDDACNLLDVKKLEERFIAK